MAEIQESVLATQAAGPAPPAQPVHCLNCGAPRAGDYCYRCGQHFLEGRLTLRRLASEFAARLFKLEQGLLHTFVQLFTRPGDVARRYVQGHRREYANPLAYFLLAATIALFAFQFTESVLHDYLLKDVERQFETLSEEAREDFARVFGEDVAAGYVTFILANMKRSYTYLSLLLVVCYSVVLRWFFSGKASSYNLAETLVFGLFVIGQMTIILSVVMPLAARIDIRAYIVAITLGYAAFCGFAALGFYGRRWQHALLAVAAFVLGYALYMAFIMLVGIAGIVFMVVRSSAG